MEILFGVGIVWLLAVGFIFIIGNIYGYFYKDLKVFDETKNNSKD